MLGQSTETNATFSTASNSSTSESKAAPKPPPLWQEVQNDDGSSYFWNPETNGKLFHSIYKRRLKVRIHTNISYILLLTIVC